MGIRDRTDLAWIAVAKSVCGASDWHRASRVPGPDAGLWRGEPAPITFEAAKCAVEVMILLLTAVLLLTPVPLSNVAPAMVISLISW